MLLWCLRSLPFLLTNWFRGCWPWFMDGDGWGVRNGTEKLSRSGLCRVDTKTWRSCDIFTAKSPPGWLHPNEPLAQRCERICPLEPLRCVAFHVFAKLMVGEWLLVLTCIFWPQVKCLFTCFLATQICSSGNFLGISWSYSFFIFSWVVFVFPPICLRPLYVF